MIKRVKLRGYKSLINLEVALTPLSVLFGPNGAGKSNFLDALQLLSRLVTSRTLRQAFESPYRGKPLESFSFGSDGIRGLLGEDSSSFSIEVDVELSEAIVNAVNQQIHEMKRVTHENGHQDEQLTSTIREKLLRYRIEVEILPRSGILRVADEYLVALNKKGEPTGSRSPFLDKVDDKLVLRREGQAHPSNYQLYLDHSILSLPHYPPHYPHLVAMAQELASWSFFYLEPRERMRAASAVKEVRHIGLMGEELSAFLNTMKAVDENQFKSIESALRMIIPSVSGLDVSVNDFGEAEVRLIEGGVAIPARVLSEGTLRVLGLLALSGVKDPPALVGFEEPENGIHPRRIRSIAELLKTRAASGDTQLIVTTHSLILLNEIPDRYVYICRKMPDGTVIQPFSPSGQLWREREINQGLDEELTISERVLRGDFDA